MSEKKESIGALWKKQTKKGEVLSGQIELTMVLGNDMAATKYLRIVVWPNNYKTEDKHPDYRIFIDDYEPKPKVAKDENGEDLPF